MKKFLYRVKENETLFSICSYLEVSPFKIIEINKLIKEVENGDLLLIEKPFGEVYTVKPLDTFENLYKIIDKSEFINKNGDVKYLFYGLKVII